MSEEGNGNPLQYSCLENPMDRGAWWASVRRVAQSWTWRKWLSMHACIGEGQGNSLQYSCLENPRDRGAWWAAVYGVAQSWTRLKRLSSGRGLHLPMLRMLNSLTWYLIFGVQVACSLCCKLVYSLTSPSACLEQFSQSYWETVSGAQSPNYSYQIRLSAFRLWLYFLVGKINII